MKKTIFIALFLLLLLVSPRLYWSFFQDETVLDIAVVDKTVPTNQYREHLGLFWLLTNEKIVRPDGELYDITKDYYGYDPKQQQPFDPYNLKRTSDLIYIADTYGVYSDDLQEKVTGERSRHIYGAMERDEWEAIMNSKGPTTTLIAEYNAFASPTTLDVRERIEQDLHVKWSGWIGRYFEDLTSDEVPEWLKRNYEQQYDTKWSFEDGGLAFVHESDTVLVIDDKHVLEGVEFSLTTLGEKRFPKAHTSEYTYWFDIVTPTNDAQILAQYNLAIDDEGLQQLQQHDIPTTFPSIVHNESDLTYYFAGDFADYTKDNLMKWYRGDVVMDIFSNEQSTFFWRSYIPIMRDLLRDIDSQT